MSDTASAQCIIVEDVHNIRKVQTGNPVVLVLGQSGGPCFARPAEMHEWDDDDEPATVVKFSRAVQALRDRERSSEPPVPAPPQQPEPAAPPPPREPTGEVPGLTEDVWNMGNPDWDIWMAVPEDEAPTRALLPPPPHQQALTGPHQPVMDPLPALDSGESDPDPLGLEILEETIRRPRPPRIPTLQQEDNAMEVELVYLLNKKKK